MSDDRTNFGEFFRATEALHHAADDTAAHLDHRVMASGKTNLTTLDRIGLNEALRRLLSAARELGLEMEP